jgi:hypothetical protein
VRHVGRASVRVELDRAGVDADVEQFAQEALAANPHVALRDLRRHAPVACLALRGGALLDEERGTRDREHRRDERRNLHATTFRLAWTSP